MKLFLIVVVGFLFACSSDDPQLNKDEDLPDNPLKGLSNKGPVRFDDPEIGQRSHYVFFKATEDNTTHEVNFDYFPDTLVLAITDKQEDKWILKEFMTNGSNSKTSDNGQWGTTVAQSVFVRHLIVNADSAYFFKPDEADPFSFVFVGESRIIPLKPIGDPAPLNVDCLPRLDYASTRWMQYTVNYSQFGQTFQHLNNYFDYRPMANDGSGFMYAYGSSFGFVRWTWVSYWDLDHAAGWDLIPN